MVEGPAPGEENHSAVIRPGPSPGVGPDWLDTSCWGCGTPDVAPHPDGRLICITCRAELVADPEADALAFSRHAYWQAHVLGCCWRCLDAAVDPADEVGLCPGCREQLA